MPRDMTTAHYDVTVKFDITEKNTYGDILNTHGLTYTVKTKASGLIELAEILKIVDEALT